MSSQADKARSSLTPVPDPDGVWAPLAEAVRDYRIRADVSQQALADAAQMHRSTIVAIEKAARRTVLDEIVRIARALHAPVSALLGDGIANDDYQVGHDDGYRKALGEVADQLARLRETGAE